MRRWACRWLFVVIFIDFHGFSMFFPSNRASWKHLLRDRERYFSRRLDELNPELLSLQWTGRSAGTYMWHMILEDLREKYVAAGGKLRVIVITDGLDTHSPEPYRGIAGMHPMMNELLKDGYDIEWHIVVVALNKAFSSEISKLDASRYEALAELTGGGFLHIDEAGAMNDTSARHFLAALEKAVTGGSLLDGRELREQQGKAARFLSRLHQSNQHLEDPELDQKRRRQQLSDYRRRGSAEVPWLALLESKREKQCEAMRSNALEGLQRV